MTTKKPDYDHIYKLVREYYVQQVLLTKELYEHQYNELERIDNPRVLSLYHLMLSIYLTGSAINLLALNNYLGESYMLARALLEKLINYMYLLVCEEDEYKKYLNYTKQRGYRVLNRSFIAGNQKVELKWAGSVNLDDYLELKEAISQFTSSKGKAVTRWTSLSLADRLNVIGEKTTINITGLMYSMLGIYDDASEALHGSLYGVTFNYGYFGGKIPSNTKEFAETYRNQLLTLFFALGTSIASLIEVISSAYPTDKVKDIERQSGNNFVVLGEYIDNNIHKGRGTGG
jgi:hypothetical protein